MKWYLRWVLVLGLFLCWQVPAYASADQARQCVEEIGRSIDAADVQRFQQYVDVDSLVETSFAAFLEWAGQPAVQSRLQPMVALLLAQAQQGQGAGSTLRVVLIREARAFLLNGIGSGAFAGRKTSYQAGSGMLAPLFANASMGRKEIVQIGQATAYENGWMVPFTILDDGNGLEYPINGYIEEQAGQLRLTRILNMTSLCEQIQEEARQYEE